jgi:hypothetical protein
MAQHYVLSAVIRLPAYMHVALRSASFSTQDKKVFFTTQLAVYSPLQVFTISQATSRFYGTE